MRKVVQLLHCCGMYFTWRSFNLHRLLLWLTNRSSRLTWLRPATSRLDIWRDRNSILQNFTIWGHLLKEKFNKLSNYLTLFNIKKHIKLHSRTHRNHQNSYHFDLCPLDANHGTNRIMWHLNFNDCLSTGDNLSIGFFVIFI